MSELLPILARRADIEAAVRAHQAVVVCGQTGSGKTTQLPQICYELGLADRGIIGHTQPRRLAARAVAARIAEERGVPLGGLVGVRVRFEDSTGPATRIRLMTDGVLLAELASDPELRAYSVVIVDEAHERSLNIDFILGYLRTLLPRRPDLKLIITSATIDPRRFSECFGGVSGCPVIEVSGRSYPIEIRHRPVSGDDDSADQAEPEAVADAVEELCAGAAGDVLVFLPGEREIRLAEGALRRRSTDADVLPLFSRLTSQEQDRIFHTGPRRRVILATNIAETSLTVPGIRSVVDTGLARVVRYDPQRKIQRLPVEPVSRASADQRAGRCGRTGPGVCVRLYSEQSYRSRPAFTDPEIRRASLAGAVLSMKSLGLGPVESFPFIDPPEAASLRDAYETLFELGATSSADAGSPLTEVGRRLARIPADPRIARMLLGGAAEGALHEVLVLAAALSIQDPRQRPLARQEEADRAQEIFRHPTSDFLTLLRLWDQCQHASHALAPGNVHAWCRDHFVSAARMREWSEMVRQLAGIAAEIGLRAGPPGASEDAVHRALLTGLITNVACREGEGGSFEYRSVRAGSVQIFPGSVLFKKSPRWIMAAEMVHTNRLYARTVARIEPEWIEELAGHMFRHQLSDHHLDATTGEPSAWERVSMSGIVVVPRRRTPLAPLDPRAARDLFILEALVQMKWTPPFPFAQHNRVVMETAKAAEARLRRRGVIAPDVAVAALLAERLPASVNNPATLAAWIDSAGAEADRAVRLSLEDVLLPEARAAADPALFPDTVVVGGHTLRVLYAFAPGKDEDGVTFRVPLAALSAAVVERATWLVPGMLGDLTLALIKTLPKPARAAIETHGALADIAAACATVMSFASGPLAPALSDALAVLYGVRVDPASWSFRAIPDCLRGRLEVVDDSGRAIAADRDGAALLARLEGRMARAHQAAARSAFERRAITEWTFGELPAEVAGTGEARPTVSYPAIVDDLDSVALTLMPDQRRAVAATLLGVRRLFALACRDEVVHYLGAIAGWGETARRYGPFGESGALERDLAAIVCERVFLWGQAPVRTAEEFERRSQEMRGRLAVGARDVGEAIARVLEARQRVAQRISGGTPRLWADSVADMREHAAYLLPRDFLRQTSWERLRHFPRYAESLRERLLALREDGSGVEKEALRILLPHWKRLTGWVAAAMSGQRAASPPANAPGGARKAPLPAARRAAPSVNLDAGEWAGEPGALPPAVERFRWALEDFRVVLFTPERAGPSRPTEAELSLLWSACEPPGRVTPA